MQKHIVRIFKVLMVLLCAAAIYFVAGADFSPSGSGMSGNWNLILVNRDNPIPDDYEVELTKLANGQKVDSRIYPELQDMFNAARADGCALFVAAGYRTAKKQQSLLDEKVQEYKNEGYSADEAQKLAENG